MESVMIQGEYMPTERCYLTETNSVLSGDDKTLIFGERRTLCFSLGDDRTLCFPKITAAGSTLDAVIEAAIDAISAFLLCGSVVQQALGASQVCQSLRFSS